MAQDEWSFRVVYSPLGTNKYYLSKDDAMVEAFKLDKNVSQEWGCFPNPYEFYKLDYSSYSKIQWNYCQYLFCSNIIFSGHICDLHHYM